MTSSQLRNKPCGGRYGDIIESIGHTPLIELKRLSPKPGVRIWVKLESRNPTGSVKDRVARALILDAEDKGLIRPGQTILTGDDLRAQGLQAEGRDARQRHA
jgi:[CysO sulfur-carrier protein]-thiocarboxylate-dependent cysteine synthase